jgi:hypothetical protein
MKSLHFLSLSEIDKYIGISYTPNTAMMATVKLRDHLPD